MKKIKNFKMAQELKSCFGCEKSFTELSTISVRITNVHKKYQNSNRPFISIYKLKLCDKCFKRARKDILNIMIFK